MNSIDIIPSPHVTAASQSVKADTCARMAAKEMGYVTIENARIVVCSGDDDGELSYPINEWLDVELIVQSTGEDEDERCCETIQLSDKSSNSNICRLCDLVLDGRLPDCLRLYDSSLNATFDGTLRDLTHAGCHNLKRSDAALLLGCLQSCREVAVLGRLNVCFHDTSYQTADLVMTITFPHLLYSSVDERSILLPTPRIKEALKPLPLPVQLLLSLVRSDWANLEVFMNRKRVSHDGDAKTKPTLSLFPDKLSLEELYARLRETSSCSSANENTDAFLDQQQSTTMRCYLPRLPKEVLMERLAPYLPARSLDCLRLTCRSLHHTLRAVVPGLRLPLYQHQISSLAWMRQREARSLTEADCLTASAVPHSSSAAAVPDGDWHRAVTGGASVLLRARYDSSLEIRLDQWTGRQIEPHDLSLHLPRKVARGGLLCDDPGLGKTITVLSLILQTTGLTTTLSSSRATVDKVELSKSSDDIFYAYWTEQITVAFREPALLKLVNDLSRCVVGAGAFPAKNLKGRVSKDAYADDFRLFEGDVRLIIFENNDEAVIRNMFEIAETRLTEFKEAQLRSARKFFSNATAKPNSRVAAMLADTERRQFLASLIPSSGTLLVIPAVLMEHWQTQIEMHVDLSYFTSRKPLIFEYSRKDTLMSADKATLLCQLYNTHCPLVFLDKAGTRPLPSAEFLATFHIVITTTQRFVNEWKNGSFGEELSFREPDGFYNVSANARTEISSEACSLLKVHWLRMIVDEGHSMSNDKHSCTIQFASWISAERRWAMTGTPTKHGSTQLGQIRGLSHFLQHEFFTPRLNGERNWKLTIAKSWNDKSLAAFFRLRSLLGLLMKRHTKRDIAELPPPLYAKSIVEMSLTEATTYNTLVGAVQTNLLVTAMEGKTSGQQDSLLHRSQAKHAREALANIRRVCVGWSRVVPTLIDTAYAETMMLLKLNNISNDRIGSIREFIHRAETENLSPCDCCGLRLSTLLLLPCCGSLLCTECMDGKSTQCLICDDIFDIDAFQRLQPGFAMTWKSNLKTKDKKEVISSGAIRDNGMTGRASIGAFVGPDLVVGNPARDEAGLPIIRPPKERRRTRKPGDGHKCEYDRYSAHGGCTLCHEEHGSCHLVNATGRCVVCHRTAENCPEEESKSFYLIRKLLSLHKRHQHVVPMHASCSSHSLLAEGARRPLKVIVFSQFRKALDFVGDRLLRRFGTGCVAEYWGKFRSQELHKFAHESECFCMLLSKDGSTGLDLSFVTHIYFLEEIWDKALGEQAVARAWRMGAKGRVEVETLLAKNTVEETMQKLESAANPAAESPLRDTSGDQLSKAHALLTGLRLMTDYHHFAGGNADTGPTWTDRDNAKRDARTDRDTADDRAAKKCKVTFQLDESPGLF